MRYNQHPESQDELDKTVTYLKQTIVPSQEKRLKRTSIYKYMGVVYDKDLASDYYVRFIKDVIQQLCEENGTAYIFNMDTLADVMRFVGTDIKVKYIRNGIYSISKGGSRNDTN